MNPKLKRQEQNGNGLLDAFPDFNLLKLAEVRLRDPCILLSVLASIFLLAFSSLFSVFFLLRFLASVVLHLDVEDDILRECVFNLNVDLESFIQFR